MSEAVTFDLLCPSCGGAVTLQIAEWGREVITDTPWVCPYCGGPHHFALPGRLVGIVRTEEPEQPN